MYGLYKNRNKYSVCLRDARKKRKLIVSNRNREMLAKVARNLNLNKPVVRLNKNIADPNLSTYILPKNANVMSNNTLSENILCGDSNQTEINQFEISQSASVCTDNVLILDCDLNIMDLSKELNNADIVLSSSNNQISRLFKIAQGETDDTGEDVQDNEHETDLVINKTCEADNRIDNDNSDVDSNSSSADTICNATNKKRKRSTSSYGPTKRIRWTQKECDVITNAFKPIMKEGHIPTGKQMVEIKMKNECLSRRSIPQIRSWIHNQISKKYKSVKNPDKTQ
ncbi:uncharacterized protein LOC143894367 [Temnothorax americanus]|uniref:uncharacterized protein LOC143894367 n=1 Tax=Temnothorax americanus TaxID=1964332 RepID=UPI0040679254